MIGLYGLPITKQQFRKSIFWHLRQLFFSFKCRRTNKETDFLTFHCWRINKIFADHYLKANN